MSNKTKPKIQRLFFVSICTTAIGTSVITINSERLGSLGLVLIALGGILLKMALSAKKEETTKQNS